MLTSLGLPPGLRARLWAKSGESTVGGLLWLLWYCPSLVVRRRPVSCVTSGVIPLERTPEARQNVHQPEVSTHWVYFINCFLCRVCNTMETFSIYLRR